MDMLMGDKIADADLADWRKLAQGLHARYLIGDFGTGARFITGRCLPQVIEHHRSREDRGQGIGDALAGDVGSRAVHRFEHRRKITLRIDIG